MTNSHFPVHLNVDLDSLIAWTIILVCCLCISINALLSSTSCTVSIVVSPAIDFLAMVVTHP